MRIRGLRGLINDIHGGEEISGDQGKGGNFGNWNWRDNMGTVNGESVDHIYSQPYGRKKYRWTCYW